MPVGGENLIVGPYTVTWNSVGLGLFVGEEGVPTITEARKSTLVNKTNRWGSTLIDEVLMGAEWFWEGILYEALLGMSALTAGIGFGLLGPIGVLKYALAKPLVMTAVAGTPASASPASVTASKAILAAEHQGKLTFGPMVRTVPLKLALYPYDTGAGVYGAFVFA